MEINVGDIVVHPHHGPATVTEIVTRKLRGVPTTYVCLDVHESNLSVQVPVSSLEEVGIRELADDGELARLVTILRGPTSSQSTNWSRRFKEDMDRARTGDLFIVAALVRDLTRRQHEQGLSLGERDLLNDVRKPLLTEIRLTTDSEGTSGMDGLAVLEAIILGGDLPPTIADSIDQALKRSA